MTRNPRVIVIGPDATGRDEVQKMLALSGFGVVGEAGYGIEAAVVDGMDVEAVEEATQKAMDYVRAGRPFFLEARTYRFRAHSMYDAELYRDKSEVVKWKQHDPITTLIARLKDRGSLS